MAHPSVPARARGVVSLLSTAALAVTGLVGVVAAPATAAATDDTVLTTGERLVEGDRLVSPSGRYALTVADDLLAIRERASVFAPGYELPVGFGVASLLLQPDGNLVALDSDGALLFSFETGGTGATAVRLQDDRNLVFFDSAGRVVADAGTYRFGFLDIGEALLPGDVLDGGAGVRLLMQPDGNLVLYRGTTPLWDSRTGGNPGAGAVLQGDGNLVVYSAARRPLFSTGTAGEFVYLQVEDTEISVKTFDDSYSFSLWSSNSRAVGDPRGANPVVAPGDELEPGEFRAAGSCRLVMQADANLVEYCAGPSGLQAVFATGGVRPPAPGDLPETGIAIMQPDGNLVVYRTQFDEIVAPLYATRTSGAGNALVLQADTNLVVYGPGGRPRWSRTTGPL